MNLDGSGSLEPMLTMPGISNTPVISGAYSIEPGARIAQMVFVPVEQVKFEVVDRPHGPRMDGEPGGPPPSPPPSPDGLPG